MRQVRTRAIRLLKVTGIFLVCLGGFYGLMNLSWLGPWTLEPLYWKPHLSYADSPNELYVTTRTPIACRLQVFYQANVTGKWDATQTVTETNPTMIHQILLSGLTLGQALKYHLEPTSDYQGMLSPAIVSDLAREFVIPSSVLYDGTSRPLRFAMYGDNRPTVFGSDNHAYMVSAVKRCNPDFVIHVGDLVQTGGVPWEWARLFTEAEELYRSIPILPTPGNHEYGEDPNSTNYLEAFRLPGNESYYAYNISNAHFISMDVSSGHGADNLAIQAQQMIWLDQHLAMLNESANAFDWNIVFFHYPILATGEEHENIWQEILGPVFAKYKIAIDLLVVGHIHQYERLFLSNVNATCIIVGGGGAEIEEIRAEEPAPGSQVLEMSHSFGIVDINGLTLRYQGVFMKGGVFDLCNITKTHGGISA